MIKLKIINNTQIIFDEIVLCFSYSINNVKLKDINNENLIIPLTNKHFIYRNNKLISKIKNDKSVTVKKPVTDVSSNNKIKVRGGVKTLYSTLHRQWDIKKLIKYHGINLRKWLDQNYIFNETQYGYLLDKINNNL